jgi:hypothetical protein
MKFCLSHWQQLRAAIDARGLTPLVSDGGRSVIEKTVDQLRTGAQTLDNFDPLMSAHWAIVMNVSRLLDDVGYNPLVLMAAPPDAPDHAQCPLCHINKLHKETCTNPQCQLEKESGYDWMIDRAADEAKAFLDQQMGPPR